MGTVSHAEDDILDAGLFALVIVVVAIGALAFMAYWKLSKLDPAQAFSGLVAWLKNLLDNFSANGWKVVDKISDLPPVSQVGKESTPGSEVNGDSPKYDVQTGTVSGISDADREAAINALDLTSPMQGS
jgi:hypothetical protein